MMREALSHFPMAWLPCLGMVIFLAVFLGVVAWVYSKQAKNVYQHLEQLPLGE